MPATLVTIPEPVVPDVPYGHETPCAMAACACLAAQWFGDPPGEEVAFLPVPTQGRFAVDAWVQPRSVRKGVGDWPVILRPFAQSGNPVVVDPGRVVSLRPAVPYDQPAGQAGLDALVAEGALLPPGDPGHAAAVAAYGEAFSARYRTRFNPDYRFVPQVDYVVTRGITLPADTPAPVFLLAPGVPLPDLNGNKVNPVCFLVADRAGDPVTGDRFNGSPFCREIPFPDEVFADRQTYLSAQAADAVVTGDHCLLPDVSAGADIVAVVVDEARHSRIGTMPPREIAVQVTGKGPLILYLQTNGGNVRWVVSGPSVAQVYTPAPPSYVHAPEVVLNGAPAPARALAGRMEGCLTGAPPRRLEGPGYRHLDQLVTTLLGRPIDRLVEVPAPGIDAARIVID